MEAIEDTRTITANDYETKTLGPLYILYDRHVILYSDKIPKKSSTS